MAANGGVGPGLAFRAWDSFGIQRLGELSGTLASSEGSEDPTDDKSLCLVDRPIASDQLTVVVIPFDHVIAIAKPTCRFAGLDPALQTATCFIGEVLQEQRVHRAFEADMK